MNDINEVCDFIKKCGTYYLATVEGDQPRVRPFGTINLFEGKLYIQTGKVKEVSKQIQNSKCQNWSLKPTLNFYQLLQSQNFHLL